jgi:hypothetical protein
MIPTALEYQQKVSSREMTAEEAALNSDPLDSAQFFNIMASVEEALTLNLKSSPQAGTVSVHVDVELLKTPASARAVAALTGLGYTVTPNGKSETLTINW